MKLAEALMERADAQRRLFQLNERLQQNALYQEGDKPAENPQELLAQYQQTASKLEKLVVMINQANHQVSLSNGLTMVEALAKRDRLKAEHGMLMNLANSATVSHDRYSRSEIKMLAAMDVKYIRQQADQIAKQHRELDILIQQANWQTDI